MARPRVLAAAALTALLCCGGAAFAQDSPSPDAATLADIRAALDAVSAELASLSAQRRPGPGVSLPDLSPDVPARLAQLEGLLQDLTARTEALEYALTRMARDGANRLGDLEFRLCELEPGCDIGQIGTPAPLGGGVLSRPASPETAAPELALVERADFEAAQAALQAGRAAEAVQRFRAFQQAYPGSPLAPRVWLGLGQALELQGDIRESARAFLSAYSGYPDHAEAPEALWRLGAALGALGRPAEACVTLGQVAFRYPEATDAIAAATREAQALTCP